MGGLGERRISRKEGGGERWGGIGDYISHLARNAKQRLIKVGGL